jgi:hypothetical protein
MSAIEAFSDRGQCGDAAIKQALHLAWERLARYYRVMTQSVYHVCLFLDPQIKTTYVENHWEESWIQQGEDRLQAAWNRYKELPVTVETLGRQPARSAATATATAGHRLPPNPFLRDIEMDAGEELTPPDELELYRQMPFMSPADWETRYSSNPLVWWSDTGRIMFPRLAMMARDYYSTQRKSILSKPLTFERLPMARGLASTAPAERLCSAAGNAEDRHQARMAPETLQAIITLRAWWKEGVLGFDSVVATAGE